MHRSNSFARLLIAFNAIAVICLFSGVAVAKDPKVQALSSASQQAAVSTVTTLTAPTTLLLGQTITVAVTVQTSTGAAVANSTVELYNGSTYTGLNATTNASGVATFVFGPGDALYLGTYSLEAQFPASGTYLGSATASSSSLQITSPTYTTTGDGLQLATVQTGSGLGAVTGQNMIMEYTGFYQSSGAEFDESFSHPPGTFVFTLNATPEQVISGFDEGSTGIEVGETRVLVIPSALGYMDGMVRVFIVQSEASDDLGPTASLIFTQPPTAASTGSAINPAIVVDLMEAVYNPNSSDTSSVTLSIGSGPSGATLGGTTTVAASSGLATFNNITLSMPGSYTLVATDGSLSAISPTFTVGTATTNAVPAISGISPAFASAGSSGFTATVNGSGFVNGSTAYWGSTALTTTYVSAIQLTAAVPASDVSTAGITAVTVETPAPGGGTSSAFSFEVDSAASGSSQSPTVTTTTVQVVQAGSPASYSVTVPTGTTINSVQGLNLPSGASVTYDASTDMVIIDTTAATPLGTYQITLIFNSTVPGTKVAQLRSSSGSGGQSPVLALFLALLLPLGIVKGKSSPRRILATASAGVALLSVAIFLSGCGGGSSSPSTPTTMTQTSSAAVTLTVQ